jgi:hypothetical protein
MYTGSSMSVETTTIQKPLEVTSTLIDVETEIQNLKQVLASHDRSQQIPEAFSRVYHAFFGIFNAHKLPHDKVNPLVNADQNTTEFQALEKLVEHLQTLSQSLTVANSVEAMELIHNHKHLITKTKLPIEGE